MIQLRHTITPKRHLLASSTTALALFALAGCAEGTLPQLDGCTESSTCAPAASGAGAAARAPALGGSGGTTGNLGGSPAGTRPAGGADAGGGGVPSAGAAGSSGFASADGGMGGIAGSAQAGMGGMTTGDNDHSTLTNFALGKSATADSQEAANGAEHGNDGDAGTRWCAADAELDHHWTVDLGGIYALSSLEITFEFDGRQYGYVVEGSHDDDDYEPLLDCTTNTKQTQIQNEPLNGSARYVRIRFVALPADTWASFYELKVMGT